MPRAVAELFCCVQRTLHHGYACLIVLSRFGRPGFDVEFYCVFKRQLNAFEMTETTNWKKGIGLVLKI